jgi:hypothetical protein
MLDKKHPLYKFIFISFMNAQNHKSLDELRYYTAGSEQFDKELEERVKECVEKFNNIESQKKFWDKIETLQDGCNHEIYERFTEWKGAEPKEIKDLCEAIIEKNINSIHNYNSMQNIMLDLKKTLEQ